MENPSPGKAKSCSLTQTPRLGVGVQARFSKADLIPSGHTARGLRPSTGSLSVWVWMYPHNTKHMCTPPSSLYLGGFQVPVRTQFLPGVPRSSPSHPGQGYPRISDSEMYNWKKDSGNRGSESNILFLAVHKSMREACFLGPAASLCCVSPSSTARLPLSGPPCSRSCLPTALSFLSWWS